MIRKILIGLALVLVVFLVVAAFQPPDFRVARSVSIAAPPAAIFPHVNDFHQWVAWSPWEKLDPEMKRSYAGPTAGNGTIYGWVGNSKVGEGRATIVESRPHELIRIKLDFVKPFAATNFAEYAFRPEGNQTTVTWSMAGRKNFVTKAICLIVSMDKMVGGDFEKGLADLKKVSETAAKN
jgi:Polyketide cyclase / dehydrase and lipid transport